MSFLEYVYNLELETLVHGSNGVKHRHEKSFVEVARTRLVTALTCEDSREAIREIVANLVGCEEFALFEIDYSKAVMWPRWSFGLHVEPQRPVDLMAYPELNNALRGQVSIFKELNRLECFPAPVRALVPIACDELKSGVLVIFSLLPQKSNFNDTDRRLLEELSIHGGRALASGSSTFHIGEK
jgi:hypothetical protein